MTFFGLTAGEDYMAYNIRRWGSDGWTARLRAQGCDLVQLGKLLRWPGAGRSLRGDVHQVLSQPHGHGASAQLTTPLLLLTAPRCIASLRGMLSEPQTKLSHPHARHELLHHCHAGARMEPRLQTGSGGPTR